MTVKIKLSYENDQEKDQVVQLLRPLLGKAKIKSPRDSGDIRYKTMYIQLRNLADDKP